MADVEIVSKSRCFGGEVRFLRHASRSTRCDMVFSVFVPPQAADGPVPVLYWLPEVFAATCGRHGHPCETRMRDGYDHSYWFIATFLPDHFAHHAAALKS
jgi:S-formylglutathione hydrolase FrmB